MDLPLQAACRDGRVTWSSLCSPQEVATAPANPVSVYYPFALVEFLEVTESDEREAVGEVLLAFLDQDGCRVSIRVRKEVLQQLLERLR